MVDSRAGVVLPIFAMSLCLGLTACGRSTRDLSSVAGSASGTAPSTHLGNRAFRQALAEFATCLRQGGIDVPVARISGDGPVLDLRSVDTSRLRFKTTWAKCRRDVDVGQTLQRPMRAGDGGWYARSEVPQGAHR
jgi:hypothetical protein